MEDKELVALYWSRSEEAVSASAEKYGALCRSIAQNILRSGEDAEECVNDTWLSAWRSIPPQRPENLQAYLARIARNLALNRRKEAGTQKRGGGEVPAALSELDECVPAPGGVEEAADALALTQALEAFLRAQPREKRNIFLRRYWYLSPVEEIARDCGMSRSRTASLLHRMRVELRRYLEQEGFL